MSSDQRMVTEARRSHLTLEEVLDTERPAWAATAEGGPGISFDGIDFWVWGDSPSLRVARKSEIPSSGWWHKDGCNCRVCRSGGGGRPEQRPSGVREGDLHG